MASILVDSGVWYALCDPRDRTVSQDVIDDIYARVSVHGIVVPWPIAYETLRTRFVRNRLAMERFEREIKSPRVMLLDDAPYRDDALAHSIEWALRRGRALSWSTASCGCSWTIYAREFNILSHSISAISSMFARHAGSNSGRNSLPSYAVLEDLRPKP